MVGKSPGLSNSYVSYRRLIGLSVLVAYSIQCFFYLLTWMAGFIPSWIMGWIRWKPTSNKDLEVAEEKILSYIKTPHEGKFVNIGKGKGWSEDNLVRTVTFNLKEQQQQDESVPMVLLHGFASGVGLWVLNMDNMAAKRTVHAFDLLGFGRSSRPYFSSGALEAEHQLIESIEEWREQMKLDRFILCGHSMGGFLAASYALKHPDHVAHLILADPWGFPEKPNEGSAPNGQAFQIPVWVKAVGAMLQPFNPLAGLRIAGPWGPRLVDRIRPDLRRKFEPMIEDSTVVTNYIYHCNAQEPSGEVAFKSMTAQFGWAKHPMISRIGELREDIPMTFIYGSRSWIDRQPGIQIKYLRPNSFVDVQIILGAGHHVYADRTEQFNSIIEGICDQVDQEEPVRQRKEQSHFINS